MLSEIKKPDLKGHILYNSIYTKYPQQANLEESNQICGFQGLEKGGNGEWLLNSYPVSAWGDEKFLELDRGDGCATFLIT